MKNINWKWSAVFILFLYIFANKPLMAADLSKVSFKTKDGVVLKAFYQPPSNSKPVVIMLHGLASNKEEWLPFANFLVSKGWGVLAYDARGHGASSKSKDMDGTPNGYQYFGKPGRGSEWERMIDDVGGAVAFIRIEKKLDTTPIYLAGASLGANVSLTYASLARSIKAVILLSPGINFAGFDTEEPIKHMTIPVLLVASQPDQYSYESCIRLSKVADVPFWSDVKAGHGVQMLDESLQNRLFEWMSKH